MNYDLGNIQNQVEKWLDAFGWADKIPSWYLKEWEETLKYKKTIFKDSLIYEKPIDIRTNISYLRATGADEYSLYKEKRGVLEKWFSDMYHKTTNIKTSYFNDLDALMEEYFSNDKITEGYSYSECGEIFGQKLIIGQKIYKVLKKFIKSASNGFPDEYEKGLALLDDLTIYKSTLTSKTSIKGDLCISTHPMDFISASHNTYSWRSCLSVDEGDYFSGAASLVNSNQAFVIYIKGADKIGQLEDLPEWNSKKWRVFGFINDKNQIYIGQQYPFSSEENVLAAIEFIKEISGIDYETVYVRRGFLSDEVDDFSLKTTLLYNDSNRCVNAYILKDPSQENASYHWVAEKGLPFFDNQQLLNHDKEWGRLETPDFFNITICPCCGDYVSNDCMMETRAGDMVCEFCFDEEEDDY